MLLYTDLEKILKNKGIIEGLNILNLINYPYDFDFNSWIKLWKKNNNNIFYD